MKKLMLTTAALIALVAGAGFCLLGLQFGNIATEANIYPTYIRSWGVGSNFAVARIGRPWAAPRRSRLRRAAPRTADFRHRGGAAGRRPDRGLVHRAALPRPHAAPAWRGRSRGFGAAERRLTGGGARG